MSASFHNSQQETTTRKLCYRKDDRAMRPIHGALKIFGTPWLRPRLLFPNIFHGLLFRSKLWMFVQNLKSVASPVPEIIGGPEKFGYSLNTPTLPFLQNFQWTFIRIGSVNVPAKFEDRRPSFTRSWDNRGYPKYFSSPWIRPRSIFSKIFNGLLFGLAL